LKVLIATIGTRGDVQPHVAIGKGLRERGHEVLLATCARFESFVTGHGLGFSPVSDEVLEIMKTREAREMMQSSSSLPRLVAHGIRLMPMMRGVVERQMDQLWAACERFRPDLVVFHPKAIGMPDFAERLGVPSVLAFYLPMFARTGEIPMSAFPDWPLGPAYRRLTYRIVEAVHQLVARPIRRWRQDHGLPARSPALARRRPDGEPLPILHGFSRHVIPGPADWPDSAEVCGYWTLETGASWRPPPELDAFLDDGEPPIYIGFGSIFGTDPEGTTRLALEAVERAGVRAVLASGWGGLTRPAQALPEHVRFIDEAPHERLFPRLAAIVHHGGCGTTSAALHAGKPQVICPFFGDQPFWGRRVAELGLGAKPLAQRRLTAPRLAAAIRQVVDDPAMAERARAMAGRLRREDGVARAVEIIERLGPPTP